MSPVVTPGQPKWVVWSRRVQALLAMILPALLSSLAAGHVFDASLLAPLRELGTALNGLLGLVVQIAGALRLIQSILRPDHATLTVRRPAA